MPPKYAVETIGLTKTYAATRDGPAKKALSSVDLAVPRGSVFGLLGPNGAGKSTFINILAGLVVKSGGTARVWGSDIETDMRRARSAIGVVPQEINLDAFFSPREVLETQAGMYGVPRRERRTMEILTALGLGDKADAYARSLSGGMRRRLLVAKALVHTPPVLVLDEPTAGVDVELRQQLWAYFRELNKAGVTIMLTTHYLEEAQELCDQIAIIDHGKVVVCEETATLLGRLDRKELAIVVGRDLAAPPPELARWRVDLQSPRRLTIHFQPSLTSVGQILDAVANAGLEIIDLTTEEADLEDVFLRLTGSSCAAEEPPVMGTGDPQAETLAVTRSRPSP
ncbi:MAG: ABC transporter ATP-binding protein [Rhodospirillales bacterium]|nr:ABC transporter ATP-binding protein [Rhodospirillales bacterium]